MRVDAEDHATEHGAMAFPGAASDASSSRQAQTVYKKVRGTSHAISEASSIYAVKVVGPDGSIDQSSHASRSFHIKNRLAQKQSMSRHTGAVASSEFGASQQPGKHHIVDDFSSYDGDLQRRFIDDGSPRAHRAGGIDLNSSKMSDCSDRRPIIVDDKSSFNGSEQFTLGKNKRAANNVQVVNDLDSEPSQPRQMTAEHRKELSESTHKKAASMSATKAEMNGGRVTFGAGAQPPSTQKIPTAAGFIDLEEESGRNRTSPVREKVHAAVANAGQGPAGSTSSYSPLNDQRLSLEEKMNYRLNRSKHDVNNL